MLATQAFSLGTSERFYECFSLIQIRFEDRTQLEIPQQHNRRSRGDPKDMLRIAIGEQKTGERMKEGDEGKSPAIGSRGLE